VREAALPAILPAIGVDTFDPEHGVVADHRTDLQPGTTVDDALRTDLYSFVNADFRMNYGLCPDPCRRMDAEWARHYIAHLDTPFRQQSMSKINECLTRVLEGEADR